MTTSASNAEIARLRGLARRRRDRREAGRFIVEGPKLVAEALESNLGVVQVLVGERADLPGRLDAAIAARGARRITVADHAIERVASTTSPQAVVAECEIPSSGWEQLNGAAPVLVAVDLNDPGNLGTLARSAEAAGFAGLVGLGATTDPWSPKAVRAAAGALFRLAVMTDPDLEVGLERLAATGRALVGTRMTDAPACDEVDLTGPVAIVFGSEAHGLECSLGADGCTPIDRWVSIPMAGPTESLNVAMSGAILSYEVARQRRHPR